MNGKFSRSFQLVKDSFHVLRKDGEIITFSLIGFLAVILAGVFIWNIFDVSRLLNLPDIKSHTPLSLYIAIFSFIFLAIFHYAPDAGQK